MGGREQRDGNKFRPSELLRIDFQVQSGLEEGVIFLKTWVLLAESPPSLRICLRPFEEKVSLHWKTETSENDCVCM